MKIIDVHTHIDYITPDFQSGVVGCVCSATQEIEWKIMVDLINQDNRVYGAFGIHPWFVDTATDDFDKRLENLLSIDSHYMIGEIGLDKYKPNMEKQMDVFLKQFDIAIKLKRIVFLHCVGAWDKILYILKQYKKSDLPVIVIHDFNEKENIIDRLLQYENIYFSFGKNFLYGRNSRIERIPSNRIFVESDGKGELLLANIINKIAEIKNEPDVGNIIYNNTKRVLKNG